MNETQFLMNLIGNTILITLQNEQIEGILVGFDNHSIFLKADETDTNFTLLNKRFIKYIMPAY